MRVSTVLVFAALTAFPAVAAAETFDAPERDGGTESRARRGERDSDRLGWLAPDFVRLQTGGFVGMVALGTGYALFDDILNLSAHYGFTPAEHAGNDVHAFSFEALVRPFDVRIEDVRVVPIYLGPGVLYAWGDEFFSKTPERFARIEKNYYEPTAWHWTVRVGAELDYVPPSGFFERHGLYYELTLLGTYLEYYRENPKTLDFEDALSSAVGYRAAF
jgi:hypothetical protein